MKQSKELAKKNWKGSGDSSVDEIWFEIKDRLGATDFLGYETNKAEGVVISLLKNNKEVKTLNKKDEGMIITNPPPMAKGKEQKMRYITQSNVRPPTFALFASKPDSVPESYRRYLVNGLRESFDFEGIPIRLMFRKNDNPYKKKS